MVHSLKIVCIVINIYSFKNAHLTHPLFEPAGGTGMLGCSFGIPKVTGVWFALPPIPTASSSSTSGSLALTSLWQLREFSTANSSRGTVWAISLSRGTERVPPDGSFKTSLKQSWKLPTPLSFPLSLCPNQPVSSPVCLSPHPLSSHSPSLSLPPLPWQYQHPLTIGGNLTLANVEEI